MVYFDTKINDVERGNVINFYGFNFKHRFWMRLCSNNWNRTTYIRTWYTNWSELMEMLHKGDKAMHLQFILVYFRLAVFPTLYIQCIKWMINIYAANPLQKIIMLTWRDLYTIWSWIGHNRSVYSMTHHCIIMIQAWLKHDFKYLRQPRSGWKRDKIVMHHDNMRWSG